jgi:hypothetical protein
MPLIAGDNIALLSFISSSFLMDSEKVGELAKFNGFADSFKARRENAALFA